MIYSKRHYSVLGIWLTLVTAFVFYKGILPGWSDLSTDFNNYYTSARLFISGEAIHDFYTNDLFHEKAVEMGLSSGAKFAPFPPPTAALYTPIAFFDVLTAKRIWLIFNLILLIALPFRIKKHFESSLWENSLILSIFFVPLASNLHFGQFYFVATFLLAEGIGYGFKRNKFGFSAVVIGCLALVKYVPILFAAYHFDSKKIRFAAITLITITSIIAVFYLIDPKAYVVYWNHLTGHINGSLSGQGKFAIGFQSIDALLNHLFVYDALENPSPFVNTPYLKPIIKWAVFGFVALADLYLLKRARFSFSKEVTSVLILSSFVLFPASASYHFLLLIVPIYFLSISLIRRKEGRPFLITTFLLLCAFSIQTHHIPTINGAPLVDLLIHFPRLWFLTFIFIYLYRYEINRIQKSREESLP